MEPVNQMKIAILCWGSLWWDKGKSGQEIKLSPSWADRVSPYPWNEDGPCLPVEFARISNDGRLTLVLQPGSPAVRTYWAVSAFNDLCDARENLRLREGKNCSPNSIHSITKDGKICVDIPEEFNAVRKSVAKWLTLHLGIDAVVWTGLPSNWKEKRPDNLAEEFSVDGAIKYLENLRDDPRDTKHPLRLTRARDYLIKAPPQTQTLVRRRALEVLRWSEDSISDKSTAGPVPSTSR